MTVREYSGIRHPENYPLIVLRHDVDKRPESSLETARIESELGLRGTYYFRIVPESFDKRITTEIASLGHEIGYHYEDMDLARQKTKSERRKTSDCKTAGLQDKEEELAEIAIESFRDNLVKLSDIVPIDTICMHGSPRSPVDSKVLWKYYDYGNFGILAEPYFDFSLEEMLYITDTGRRWDGTTVSIRDKVLNRDTEYYSSWKRKPLSGSAMSMTEKSHEFQGRFRFRGTENIMEAVREGSLTTRLMITFHPQRWSDNNCEWTKELIGQNVKNQIKYLININNRKFIT